MPIGDSLTGNPDILSALGGMSNADLAKLLRANNTANRSALVQQQLDGAQKLIDSPIDSYRSPLGAMFGAAGGMMNSALGQYQKKGAQDQQQALMAGLEDPSTARLTFGGGPASSPPPGAAPSSPGAPSSGDLSAFIEPLIQHRLAQGGGAVGSMGMPGPLDKQQLLIQLLRSGGAGDLSALSGMS